MGGCVHTHPHFDLEEAEEEAAEEDVAEDLAEERGSEDLDVDAGRHYDDDVDAGDDLHIDGEYPADVDAEGMAREDFFEGAEEELPEEDKKGGEQEG